MIDESEEYSTLAGYLLERFGALPKPEDACSLEWGPFEFHFTVKELDGRRISSVAIERQRLEPHFPSDESHS